MRRLTPGDAAVVTWVTELVLESSIETFGFKFDGSGVEVGFGSDGGMGSCGGGLHNGARLLVVWGAEGTLECNSGGRIHQGRAHAQIDNLPRRLVIFVGPLISLFLSPLLLVGKLLLAEFLGANLLAFHLECIGSGGGSSIYGAG
jgi:hypothetical protein